MQLFKAFINLGIAATFAVSSAWLHNTEASAQSTPPIAILVNGNGDCCTVEMRNVIRKLEYVGATIIVTPWDSFTPRGAEGKPIKLPGGYTFGSLSNDSKFVNGLPNFVNKIDPSIPVILIGHSFGGDSLLSAVPRINRRILFFGVLDPIAAGGLRAPIRGRGVPSNVDYFFNRYQTTNAWPVENRTLGANEDGKVRNCQAKMKCDQEERSTEADADGNLLTGKCGWLGRQKCQKRLQHEDVPKDAFIQREIIDRINPLIASYQPPMTSKPAPITDLSLDARFRAINDWASARGHVSAFSNFHQADHGQGLVYGGVLLNPGTAVVRDVPVAELGNPSTNEERFRAVNDWAVRNGYAAAFPNFHQADYGQGVVFGVVLLNPGTAVVRDVPMAELGNPQTNEDRFRAVNDWAIRQGYASAFPNFHQADYGQGVVFGVVLLNPTTVVVRDVPVSELR